MIFELVCRALDPWGGHHWSSPLPSPRFIPMTTNNINDRPTPSLLA